MPPAGVPSRKAEGDDVPEPAGDGDVVPEAAPDGVELPVAPVPPGTFEEGVALGGVTPVPTPLPIGELDGEPLGLALEGEAGCGAGGAAGVEGAGGGDGPPVVPGV